MRPRLPEREIAAKHRQSGGAESLSESNEERRHTIRTGAVCQDQAVRVRTRGAVQEASNWRLLIA